MAKTEKSPRYGEAVEELETILEELENDSIDVDELATKVKRAKELLEFCRERLTRTQTEIEQVMADVDARDADDA